MPKLGYFFSALFCSFIFSSVDAAENFYFQVQPLSPATQMSMQNYSWHAGCPAPFAALNLVKLNYYGFDGNVHAGELIINKSVNNDLKTIFSELFRTHFPIAKIRPIDDYQGNDIKAMTDNDTYAFDCRAMTENPHIFSQHSYGTAIDINPLQNPYVNGYTVLPMSANAYLNRAILRRGMITRGDFIYTQFKAMGWQWGGDWTSLKDYQHFQKT